MKFADKIFPRSHQFEHIVGDIYTIRRFLSTSKDDICFNSSGISLLINSFIAHDQPSFFIWTRIQKLQTEKRYLITGQAFSQNEGDRF